MTEAELERIEQRARTLAEAAGRLRDDLDVPAEVAAAAAELGRDVPWLVAEVRRLRQGPGMLGAMLRLERLRQGRSLEEVAHEARVDPETVRALEEGLRPTIPETQDAARAVAGALGIGADRLPPG